MPAKVSAKILLFFSESVNIKKNVKKFGFHMLREIRYFVFYLHQDKKKNKKTKKEKLKKNFGGTDKENTCAILELLEDFIFSDKRSGSAKNCESWSKTVHSILHC